jgi:hypothetical protein
MQASDRMGFLLTLLLTKAQTSVNMTYVIVELTPADGRAAGRLRTIATPIFTRNRLLYLGGGPGSAANAKLFEGVCQIIANSPGGDIRFFLFAIFPSSKVLR